MKILLITLFLFASVGITWAEEGDFWRLKEKEELGWEIIDQDFSHIIYKDQWEYLWTRCHSCMKLYLLKDTHKLVIDRREQAENRKEWNKKNWLRVKFNDISFKVCKLLKMKYYWEREFTEEPPAVIMVGDRIIDYEELYYCNECYQPEWEVK